MKTVLYCRVSTIDQTVEHQLTQAHQNGFRPDLVLSDHGVSGISTRLSERPEGRRLFDVLRDSDTLVVRWIDRLGRNYQDVTDTVREFIRRGIRIETVINRMSFDGTTTDPMKQAVRDSLVAFMAAMAKAQAEVTKESQKAGIAHAQMHDDGTKYRGRKPTFTWDQFARVRELLHQGLGVSAVAKTTGLKRQSIYRIQAEPEKQLAALRAWYPTNFKSRVIGTTLPNSVERRRIMAQLQTHRLSPLAAICRRDRLLMINDFANDLKKMSSSGGQIIAMAVLVE